MSPQAYMIAFILTCQGIFILVFFLNSIALRHRKSKPHRGTLPPITVCIPARNEENNLPVLLPSLLSQTYPDFNVIVYDDDSEDGTARYLAQLTDSRIRVIKGSGPPPDWVGKVHALYQATRGVDTPLLLFLDADVELMHSEALETMVRRLESFPEDRVLTALPRFGGRGTLLVSLVPNAILTALPWFLPASLRTDSMGALNGQCWMIRTEIYRALEPHLAFKNEILEDVTIGRFLKKKGYAPELVDLRNEVTVHMYTSIKESWNGFRKNAYLLLGGHPLLFLGLFLPFALVFTFSPLVSLWMLIPLFLNKALTDRYMGYSVAVTLCAPLTYLLATTLQLDSALHHWFGKISWKNRGVGLKAENEG